MKIFFLNWNSFCDPDILDALEQQRKAGIDISVIKYAFDREKSRDSKEFSDMFGTELKKTVPDFVFSMNYFPDVSKVCNGLGVKYVSWVYDNPQVVLYNYTVINKCNYIFLFDSQMYEAFAGQGIKTVYYLPLAANVRRLDKIKLTAADHIKWDAEVSFCGQLYAAEHNFYDRIAPKLSEYTRGYLESLIRAQMQVDGINFVEKALPDNVIRDMASVLELQPNFDGVETYAYLYAQYVVNRKITSLERSEILQMIASKYRVSLYSKESLKYRMAPFLTEKLDKRSIFADNATGQIENRGPLDYFNEMPIAFKTSKINLNITLRSIQSGIPLRVFDIMGCGSFLISNYQPDLLYFFTPGEDFVYYENRSDLMDKMAFYLSHSEERHQIAAHAHAKISAGHTFDIRLQQIIKIVMK